MLWIALLLGVVEGITEFLPISSTGHLVVVSELAGFQGRRAEVFQIFIQLGAILSVVWEFRGRLGRVVARFPHEDHVRILPQHMPEALCERKPDLWLHGDLPDVRQLVLYRVFDGHDVGVFVVQLL